MFFGRILLCSIQHPVLPLSGLGNSLPHKHDPNNSLNDPKHFLSLLIMFFLHGNLILHSWALGSTVIIHNKHNFLVGSSLPMWCYCPLAITSITVIVTGEPYTVLSFGLSLIMSYISYKCYSAFLILSFFFPPFYIINSVVFTYLCFWGRFLYSGPTNRTSQNR